MKEHRATKGKTAENGIRWGATLAALLAGASGCADHVQSAVAVCPCDQGVCCTSGVCASEQNACEQATQALSSESAGHWTGYIENHNLASGSDALDLTLTETGGSLSGQIILGQGTVPAPATDGTVGWGTDFLSPAPWQDNIARDNIGVMEGFAYHVSNVRWTALRLRFEIDLGEPWGPWCRLQQASVLWTDPTFLASCIPTLGGQVGPYPDCAVADSSGFSSIPIDCGKMALCWPNSGACTCTDSACDAGKTYGLTFDVALRADEGDGSVADRESSSTFPIPTILGSHNVRLIRASN